MRSGRIRSHLTVDFPARDLVGATSLQLRADRHPTENMLNRLWANLIGRIGGPMTFRLVVQPAVASFFAIRGGIKDAREGRRPHAWVILTDSARRKDLLRESWQDVAKVFVAAIIIDLIYQVTELHWFYPEEALIVAALLAILPYLLLRGVTNRIVRHWPYRTEM
jgi:hypothetical protein